MSFIWDLTHILQVFRYEILLNIDFPWNIIEYGKIMEFANGDVEEIESITPDVVGMLVDFAKLDKYTIPLQENYSKAGIETPFLIEAYSLFFTKSAFLILVAIPTILTLNIKCGKNKFVVMAFSFLFFNGLVRIIVEMYIDASVEIFLNATYL